MKWKNVFLMLCVMMMFCACQSVDDNSPPEEVEPPQTAVEEEPVEEEEAELILLPREEIVLTSGEQAIAAGNNAFAFDLLRRVSGEEPDNNLMISPLSLSLALAMLNNGAAGTTQEEIQRALGAGDLTREELNGYFRKVVAAMRVLDPEVTFESANAIWAHEAFPVLDAFKKTNRTYFDAEAHNFIDRDAVTGQINDWCSEKTHGMIPILMEGRAIADAYLLNALYFKGRWTTSFDTLLTKEAVFANHNGAKAKASMMRFAEAIPLPYQRCETFRAVELPYGNGTFGMVLLLPAEGVSVVSVIEKLDVPAWEDCLSRMQEQHVWIFLPRFKADYTRSLNEDLKALGMTSMFGNADLSLLSPVPASVSSVLQKTAIDVKESGTEAAAVTAISIVGQSPNYPWLEFNRPFIYFIREKTTGVIAFSGIVRNL
jgi:serpin B